MCRRVVVLCALALVALLMTSGVGQAHYVWLEREGTGPGRAYFGEYGEDLKEKSGGLLDRIATPRAFLTDPATSLPIERRADHLETR